MSRLQLDPTTPLLQPRGSILEQGSENHSKDGVLGPDSIMVVYVEPLVKLSFQDLGSRILSFGVRLPWFGLPGQRVYLFRV